MKKKRLSKRIFLIAPAALSLLAAIDIGLGLAAVGFVVEPDARIVFGATNEVYSSVWFGRGTRLMGAGLCLIGLWLVYYDMARG